MDPKASSSFCVTLVTVSQLLISFSAVSLLHAQQTLWGGAWQETEKRSSGMGKSARPLGGTEKETGEVKEHETLHT
jgi:hypothetical protein